MEMSKEKILSAVEEFAKASVHYHDAGHDWWHIERVRNLAIIIYKAEQRGNRFIIELSALLHDVDDRKFSDRNDTETRLTELLSGYEIDPEVIGQVININKRISFSSDNHDKEKSVEFMIVQDADRLDAMGAIGIARAFNYGGFRNNAIYDPIHINESTVGHFYDKLLKLKDLMNTESGRRMAEERHRYMEEFLSQFYREWDNEA
jgi:uncharacterized protein